MPTYNERGEAIDKREGESLNVGDPPKNRVWYDEKIAQAIELGLLDAAGGWTQWLTMDPDVIQGKINTKQKEVLAAGGEFKHEQFERGYTPPEQTTQPAGGDTGGDTGGGGNVPLDPDAIFRQAYEAGAPGFGGAIIHDIMGRAGLSPGSFFGKFLGNRLGSMWPGLQYEQARQGLATGTPPSFPGLASRVASGGGRISRSGLQGLGDEAGTLGGFVDQSLGEEGQFRLAMASLAPQMAYSPFGQYLSRQFDPMMAQFQSGVVGGGTPTSASPGAGFLNWLLGQQAFGG